MKWQVAFDPAAERQFSKLGRAAQNEIVQDIAKHLEFAEDPRRFGEPFPSIRGAGRNRVGDYRLVCLIQNDKLIGLVVKVGPRRDVYR